MQFSFEQLSTESILVQHFTKGLELHYTLTCKLLICSFKTKKFKRISIKANFFWGGVNKFYHCVYTTQSWSLISSWGPTEISAIRGAHWLQNGGWSLCQSCWKCILPRVEITLPSVTRDLLILAPSFNLAPEVDATSALSLPARSTRWILLNVLRGSSASNHACNVE